MKKNYAITILISFFVIICFSLLKAGNSHEKSIQNEKPQAIKDYRIVIDQKLTDRSFADQVYRQIEQGWIPVGGVVQIDISNTEKRDLRLAQAMVK